MPIFHICLMSCNNNSGTGFVEHLVYMKMPITICLKKAFIIDNQLDRNFYIRGRHEDADNSLCKS